MLLMLVLVMLGGCSAADVKNKYDQAGPSSSMTGGGSWRKVKLVIKKDGKVVEKEVIEDAE